MKTKKMIVLLFLFVFGYSYAQQETTPSVSGYIRNYTGVFTGEDYPLSILQNTVNLELGLQNSRTGFFANPYIYHYTDHKLEWGLREAYMDIFLKNMGIRIGKQQIIWGKAEGVFITDVVSPKDMSEFLLPDFDEIRTGISSVKFNYFSGNHTFEAVWAPVFTPTRMPGSESDWAPVLPFPVVPEWDMSAAEVKPSLENSEVFVRYSLMATAADLELVGGTFFFDDPSLFITRRANPESGQLTGITLRPEYQRVSMAGGSFSLPLSSFVVRGEGAWYTGRSFQTQAPGAEGSLIEKDNLHYMAGIDYTLAGTRLSLQFIQEHILDYESGIQNREFENTMTFLAKRDFLREKLWLDLFAYIGLTSEDALIRPKITYSVADGFELLGGANIFVGNEGRFGQYDKNDMLYIKVKYSF
jgi:hypothetical protein